MQWLIAFSKIAIVGYLEVFKNKSCLELIKIRKVTYVFFIEIHMSKKSYHVNKLILVDNKKYKKSRVLLGYFSKGYAEI